MFLSFILVMIITFVYFRYCCRCPKRKRSNVLLINLLLRFLVLLLYECFALHLAYFDLYCFSCLCALFLFKCLYSYVADAWNLLKNDGRVLFQNQFQCCGGMTYNDTFAGQPCPDLRYFPSANQPCIPSKNCICVQLLPLLVILIA